MRPIWIERLSHFATTETVSPDTVPDAINALPGAALSPEEWEHLRRGWMCDLLDEALSHVTVDEWGVREAAETALAALRAGRGFTSAARRAEAAEEAAGVAFRTRLALPEHVAAAKAAMVTTAVLATVDASASTRGIKRVERVNGAFCRQALRRPVVAWTVEAADRAAAVRAATALSEETHDDYYGVETYAPPRRPGEERVAAELRIVEALAARIAA